METMTCKGWAVRAALFVVVCFLSSCVTPRGPGAATVDHIVIVWLKRPGNATDKAKLVAVSREFAARIPKMRHLAWGEALPSARPNVDDSFDLAFIMEFPDRASLEAYENHPDHVRAVKEALRPLARRVLVYDIARP